MRRPLVVAVGTTAVIMAASSLLPPGWEATGVALAFLGMTYWLAIRGDDTERIRHYGLALGGLVELEALDPSRLLRDGWVAFRWALLLSTLFFPPFWAGYVWWNGTSGPFLPALPPDFLNLALGHLLVIALPEEAFYRGYLQTALDDALTPRLKVLGATIGPGLILTSLLFALGHVATTVHPYRLAVFFPSLTFGWLRARTGGIGAGILFHAACNLFAVFLQHGYGQT